MGCNSFRVDVSTDASGNASAFTQGPVNGRIENIRYTPDGTNPLATGADITITGETSGIVIITKANIGTSAFSMAPRQPTHLNSDGSAALYAAAGQSVNDKIALGGERIKVAVAQGGNTLSGRFDIVTSDD